MSMNKETIEQAIKDNFEDNWSFHYSDYSLENSDYAKFAEITELEFVSNEDVEEYDSYGSEDSTLKRVFRHIPSDTYFMFKGTRCSYQGEEWNDIVEVQPKTKTTTIYE